VIGCMIIYSYKLIKKLTKKNQLNKGILPSYEEKSFNNYFDKSYSSLHSISFSFSNQKILETSIEEQTINTVNTLNGLINIDTAKEKISNGLYS